MSNEDTFDGLAEGMREIMADAPEDPNATFLVVEESSGDLVLFARGPAAGAIRRAMGLANDDEIKKVTASRKRAKDN